jgi:hypothetical protein
MSDVDHSPPPLLVFVHIPKTGGTTVRTILESNEPGERTRALSNVFKGGGGLDPELIERLRDGHGPDLKATRVVRGHFPLGVRTYLPMNVARGRELLCFTFLREPVDRSLAHYFQIREKRESSSGPAKFARSLFPPEPSLDDMLEAGFIHDNLQTRMLSGLPEPFGEVTEEMLERAKQNLSDGLVFFGLTERFDESLVLAKQRLGLSSILYESDDRVNTTRPRGEEVPEELVEAAERCNRFDIQLYRHARELFESVPERGQLEFEVELAALRAARVGEEAEIEAPPAEGFAGEDRGWRMLVEARATLLRRELDRARSRIPDVASTQQQKALENELKVARARTQELEREVERLHTASAKAQQREAKKAQAATARTEELEQEVNRLQAAATPGSGAKAGGSHPKRASRRASAKAGGSRPKRAAKRRAPSRSNASGADAAPQATTKPKQPRAEPGDADGAPKRRRRRSRRSSTGRRAEPRPEAGADSG